MKILLVEDDLPLGQALHEVLANVGYLSTWVKTAEDGKRFLQAENFDLAVLDIVLPAKSGLELLKWLRQARYRLPILMLSARDLVSDRVLGLDTGADDYLAKPFAMEELLSRIRSLLRRGTEQRTALWIAGPLAIDTAKRTVTKEGVIQPLTPRELAVLMQLAAKPGVVLTRLELAKGSNVEDPLDSNAVDFQVHSLRKKLGSELIGTVRGVGYFLNGEQT